VDPLQCTRPHDFSRYFAQSYIRRHTDNESLRLHFSYETCGNLNLYSTDASMRQTLERTASRDVLRISMPGDSSNHYSLVSQDPGVAGTGRDGAAIRFFASTAAEYGLNWTVVPISNESRASHPNSSFTACVHEVALNGTDLCVGNFWQTPARLLISTFTSQQDADRFRVVVFSHAEALSLNDVLGQAFRSPFAPFSKDMWIVLLVTVAWVGLTSYVLELDYGDCSKACNRSGRAKFGRSMFYSLHAFSSGGDFRQEPVKLSQHLNLLAFGFAILVTVTNYTAEVTTSAVVDRRTSSLNSFAEGIAQGKVFCGPDVIRNALMLRYPNLRQSQYLRYKTSWTTRMLEAMDAGICHAAIVTENAWDVSVGNGDHCETKKLLPETVFELGNSMPVREALQHQISWAFVTEQKKGVFAAMTDEAKAEFLEPAPAKCIAAAAGAVAETNSASLHVTAGGLFISLAVSTLLLLINLIDRLLKPIYQKNRGLAKQVEMVNMANFVETPETTRHGLGEHAIERLFERVDKMITARLGQDQSGRVAIVRVKKKKKVSVTQQHSLGQSHSEVPMESSPSLHCSPSKNAHEPARAAKISVEVFVDETETATAGSVEVLVDERETATAHRLQGSETV